MAKMHEDSSKKKGGKKARACLDRMCDPYTLLGMLAMLPLLDAIDVLISFAQCCDVFICEFIDALERCRGQLYALYRNTKTICLRGTPSDCHEQGQGGYLGSPARCSCQHQVAYRRGGPESARRIANKIPCCLSTGCTWHGLSTVLALVELQEIFDYCDQLL